LYVGRLKSLKGVQYLIRAFQNIKKEDKKLKLVIVGRGEFETYLRKIALNQDDIVFIGYVDSINIKKALYQNSLAVVLPSIYETFPMVVLEAMACDRPVIATDVGGIPLLVEHGKNGFLVKPRAIRDLELCIKVLRDDSDLRKNMGTNGRRIVEEKFSEAKMADETLKVYKSLL
jgi:glycosyltransferase involved in cell wall biosynthesis